jgi:hypothetical protein
VVVGGSSLTAEQVVAIREFLDKTRHLGGGIALSDMEPRPFVSLALLIQDLLDSATRLIVSNVAACDGV